MNKLALIANSICFYMFYILPISVNFRRMRKWQFSVKFNVIILFTFCPKKINVSGFKQMCKTKICYLRKKHMYCALANFKLLIG